jgi:hypothetical protein
VDQISLVVLLPDSASLLTAILDAYVAGVDNEPAALRVLLLDDACGHRHARDRSVAGPDLRPGSR